MVTAIIGAGGKTSLVHSLTDKYIKEGKKVFVTTTTHMYVESDTLITDDAELIISSLNKNGYVMAGKTVASQLECSDHNAMKEISRSVDNEFSGADETMATYTKPKKIQALSNSTYEKVCSHADEILVEADGSKHFPLKMLNANEPVIPGNADKIVIVCGLHALGRKASEAIFRLNTVNDNFGINADDIVTPKIIQTLLREGYLKKIMENYSNKEITIHAAGARNLYEKAIAALLEADIDVNVLDSNWFLSKPKLTICGAGHVAKEVAEIANKIEMTVRVIDPRLDWANQTRFPNAEIINEEFSSLDKYLLNDGFYVVLTPGHKDDLACVSAIMKSNYKYLGMIGSHKKVENAINSLKELGFNEEQISSLHAPIGLPIKAETPAEIAISIMAEIISIKNSYFKASVSEALLNTDKKGMLCIIISKEGSTPRGVGSMMLVTDNEIIDTIGGGPIENAVIQAARAHSTAFIEEFILNNTDAGNLGMTCGGKNRVLFLPI